jgi:4-amino-4-deoxy-L-arabinose transferase-like glycosyltransferase
MVAAYSTASILILVAGIILAAVVSLLLMVAARRKLKPKEGSPQAQIFGVYSPILTWLNNHVRYPQSRPAAAEITPKWVNTVLALGVVGTAAAGQYFYTVVSEKMTIGVFFFGISVLLFAVLVRRCETSLAQNEPLVEEFKQPIALVQSKPLKAVLVGLSLILAVITLRLLQTKPNEASYWDVFVLWIASFSCYAAAFISIPHFEVIKWTKIYRQELIAVSILTLSAAFFRFSALGAVPNIIDGDEGTLGMIVLNILGGHNHNMMATTFGNSTLYLFFLAGLMKIFGTNTMALRMGSAIGGTLAIPILYLLARRFFNSRVALIAGALLTVSNFHIHFSRVVVATSIQDALFATLTFYLFLTGLYKRSLTRMVLAGLVIGFDLYVYMGSRLVILFLPVYAFTLLITNRKLITRNWGNLLACAGALLVISAPMMMWAAYHLDEFNARANQIGIIQSGWLANEAVKTGRSQVDLFLELLRQAFLTVNYYPSYAFHYSTMPMLDFFTGMIFILGLVYALIHVKDPRYLLLNGWFWSGVLVGGALVVTPSRNAYRIMIVFPAVCLFVAIGWDRLVEFSRLEQVKHRFLQILPTVVFIGLFAFINLKTYFFDYALTCSYEDKNTRLASLIGAYAGKLGPSYTPYLLTAPRVYYGVYQSMDFLDGKNHMNEFKDPLTTPPTTLDPLGKSVFFFTPQRQNELAIIQSALPGGKVDMIYDCHSPVVIVYLFPTP